MLPFLWLGWRTDSCCHGLPMKRIYSFTGMIFIYNMYVQQCISIHHIEVSRSQRKDCTKRRWITEVFTTSSNYCHHIILKVPYGSLGPFLLQVLYDAGSPGTEKVTLYSVWSPDNNLGAALPLQVLPPPVQLLKWNKVIERWRAELDLKC